MNAERLLQHYEQIADAPDAVARLRRFILDLAVRGKLVPQDATDKPVQQFDSDLTNSTARHFRVPASWRWSRLSRLGQLKGGGTPSKNNSEFWHGEIPWVSPKDMKVDRIAGAQMSITAAALEGSSVNLIDAGSLLFVVRGMILAHSFPVAIAQVDVTINQDMKALIPKEKGMADYLLRALWGLKPQMLAKVQRSSHGTCRLEGSDYSDFLIPLPPLPEQHRIVAKVDELMALCDALEAARTERETKRDRLAAASLARLNTPDPGTFHDDARFALNALPALTARPDQIKQLRQTILNLAVRGKLVQQDPADEPAEELLRRISEERAKRARTGAIPKPKATNRDVARLSSGLPVGWSPIALGDVCDLVTSGSRGWGEYYAESGPRFVRAQNIRFGRMRLDDLACVQPPSNSEGARTQLYRKDLLIVITGAGVTNPALLEVDLGEAYVSQHIGLVRPSNAGLSQWLLLCLMADAGGRGELLECAYGAGKPGLNLDNIRSLSVPLPPLAEQHRIVTKVDALMALCDQLETSLTSADETRKRLLDALLAEALAPNDTEALKEAAE